MTSNPNTPPSDPRPRPGSSSPHRLGKAALAVPALAVAGWLATKSRGAARDSPLPLPLDAEVGELATRDGRLATYAAGPAHTTEPPLLLIHSINAAATAYEVRPIFEANRGRRRVYALDLPGYGLSERPQRLYTPRIMTDAILAMVDEIRRREGPGAIDALALSLSSEFLARAASERPELFGSIALVSPTGFDSRGPRNGPPGSNRGMPALYKGFTVPLWRRGFFDLLTSRVSIRYFLEKTWGSKNIDQGLLDYDYVTTHQPGAEHAPYSFISGFLFSNDITRVYDSLTLPVWFVHGVRGDFVDYRGKTRIEGRPNWTVDVLPTGALPQFEQPAAFQAGYEAFMARHRRP